MGAAGRVRQAAPPQSACSAGRLSERLLDAGNRALRATDGTHRQSKEEEDAIRLDREHHRLARDVDGHALLSFDLRSCALQARFQLPDAPMQQRLDRSDRPPELSASSSRENPEQYARITYRRASSSSFDKQTRSPASHSRWQAPRSGASRLCSSLLQIRSRLAKPIAVDRAKAGDRAEPGHRLAGVGREASRPSARSSRRSPAEPPLPVGMFRVIRSATLKSFGGGSLRKGARNAA